MASARIHDLLRLGPGERIVFERAVPTAPAIARLIASFANTHGGTIVFGIKRRQVVGIGDPRGAINTINRAAQLVSPPILIEPHIMTLDSKQVIMLDVPPGYDTPYVAADGQIVVRSGTKITPANAEQAAELVQRAVSGATLMPVTQRLQAKNAAPTPSIDLEHILSKLERLIIANAELARKLDDASSWRSRLTDQMIGAVLGLIVSTLAFYLLGFG